jgi:hypothetical protein
MHFCSTRLYSNALYPFQLTSRRYIDIYFIIDTISKREKEKERDSSSNFLKTFFIRSFVSDGRKGGGGKTQSMVVQIIETGEVRYCSDYCFIFSGNNHWKQKWLIFVPVSSK